MKVMQINSVYKFGSTGKIVYDLHCSLLYNGIDSIVCYGRGKKENEQNVYKVSSEALGKYNNLKSRFTGLQYGGCFISTNRLIKIIEIENPDIIHIQCINGFFVNIYKLIEYIKVHHIKTVMTLHAEFMHTGNCGHAFDCEKWKTGCGNCGNLKESTNSYFFDRTAVSWNKMKNAFSGFRELHVVSVSPWLMKRAMESSILSDKKHSFIFNGVDTKNLFHYRDSYDLREKLNFKDTKVILHVTSDFTSDIKGGKYIIELAKRVEGKNIKVVVIGAGADELNIPSNILYMGVIKNQEELAKFYSMADLTVITSSRETYSMPVCESLCCGTPVVGFYSGGPESIALPEFSEFVEYGSLDKLEAAVDNWIDFKVSNSKFISEKSCNIYSKEKMCASYIKTYIDLIDQNL
jgi:putative colanic acid biosynthesis glycosyltransferase